MYTAYDSLLNNKKPIQMENLMKHLGLENKSENDVINMVKGLELKAAKNDELETKVTDLTNEVNTLKEVAVDQLKAKAETLIDNAVEAGKLQKDSKDKWIELAITNFDLTKETLGSLTVTKKKTTTITNIIDQSANSDKDYEWMAINDPQGLINLAQDNPEKFEQLSKEFNHKQRTVN
jgi:polyhydroxyalkanoate synthesis regulator phasin